MLGAEIAAGFAVIHEDADHNAGNGALRGVGGMGAAQVRAAPAGIRQIDQNIRAFHLGPKIDGDLIQGGFAGGIACLAYIQGNAAGGVQNAAGAPLHHAGEEMIADHGRGDGIDPEADLIILYRGLHILRAIGDLEAGIVEHNIHGNAQGVDLGEHALHRVQIVQIRGYGAGLDTPGFDFSQHFFGMREAAAVENQVAALIRHEQGGEIADAAGGTGDEGPFSFDVIHVQHLLYSVLMIIA